MKSVCASRLVLAALVCAGPLTGAAFAQAAASDPDRDTVFVLGRIENGIAANDGETVSATQITAEEMQTYDRASVDEAVNHVAGASASNTGGSRNERLIFVRGFDRFQTSLSIDGVRVFLPADNRIDFSRFLTGDLAEVQVAKGYVSVLNGPGGVGGAVNLVTRKPSRALEAELAASVTTDGDLAQNGTTISGLVGTRQDLFYLQVSGVTSERDSWSLSDDFQSVVPALEDGGERGNSATKDWSVNAKVGFTPNATDEYALSYIKQSGEKNAPYHVSDTASTRFWTWPYWDIESIYFLSRTRLGDGLELRSRIYHNTFENLLSSFDNAAQQTQSLPRAFDSYYDDTAYGANVTLEAKLTGSNTLTGALHYRKDEHNERQDGFIRTPASGSPFVNAPYAEPWQPTEEDTYSIAVEDVQTFGAVDLVLGASYDWTDLIEARDVNVSAGGTAAAPSPVFSPVNYPLKDRNALNGQATLIWKASDTTRLHASVSSRSRFATLFERFSSRFGAAIPNPGVKPERATNFEVGAAWDLDRLQLKTAAFYSDLNNALVQVPVNLGGAIGVVNQTRNVADAHYAGVEFEIEGDLSDTLKVGGNLTLISREFERTAPIGAVPTNGVDPSNPDFHAQGVPDSKALIYADWRPLPAVSVTPWLEVASSRWTVTSSSAITPPRFYETGVYGLLNLSVKWDITDIASLTLTGKNLTDQNYVLVDGFPEEGRNFTATLRLRN